MKKRMTVVILSLSAIVALVFVIGLFLPKQREFVKTYHFKSPPEKVFQIVTDVEHQKTWRSDVLEIKVINRDTWTEVPRKGWPITFKTKQRIENKIFEIEVIEPQDYNGYWIGTFEHTSMGTKVVFKEVVTIKNPFFRLLSLMFIDLDKTMETYLTDLKTRLGE